MKLKEILVNTNIETSNDLEIENLVGSINNLNKINSENTLYILRDIKSLIKNGRKKVLLKPIDEMIFELKEVLKENTIKAIIIPKILKENENFEDLFSEIIKLKKILILETENIAAVEAAVASNFYNHPSVEMDIIAVYGDENGNLTSKYIEEIYKASNIIYKYINEKEEFIEGALEFQKYLRLIANEGIKIVIVNTSAVSLKYDIYLGTVIKSAIFTDVSEDKVFWEENFKNLNEYLKSVLKLFTYSGTNIINNDDFAADYIKNLNEKYFTYGLANKSTYNATDVNIRALNTNYLSIIDGKVERISLKIAGIDAVFSSLAALSFAINNGLDIKNIKYALNEMKIEYENEMFENDIGLQILLDKSSSPQKIDKILKENKKLVTGRIVVLASRDGLDIYDDLVLSVSKTDFEEGQSPEKIKELIKEKIKKKEDEIKQKNKEEVEEERKIRERLGQVISRHADIAIITTGSSKYENANQIIEEIAVGINKNRTKVFKFLDRKEAVNRALYNIQKRDLVAIFGLEKDEKIYNKGKEENIKQKEIIRKYIEENKDEIELR